MAGPDEDDPEPTASADPRASDDPRAAEADPRGDPYLRTRFAIPARPATFLRRDRLVTHLDQALGTPLTMVNGAAGAGKTLLLADWAAGVEGPLAWFTTDAADLGPGVFWAYLIEALRPAGVTLPPGGGSPADASHVPQTLLARLAAELSTREQPVVLVLDEYDRVTDPEIAEQLEFVLHHAGAGLRLVLVTRTEPLLPLHRYRAAGDLTEIRGAELAFTPEEAAALLALHGLTLPVSAAQALVERTRGWAAGLRLCALAAQEDPDPERYLKEFEADRSTVADFLLAEVLKRQSPEIQDLLLRVSVLERFGPELANALTGRSDAGPLLAGLHRDNAFVEHLGHDSYRLHPLFGEILRAHLRMREPGLEPELHGRAARWLRRSGSLTETLTHGAAAGDWEFTAGALVDDLAIGRLFTGLHSDDLVDLFAGMAPEAHGPAPDLVRAARDLARRDPDHGRAPLHRAEQALAELRRAADPPDTAAAELSCALLKALAARLTGAAGPAEEAAETAVRLRERIPVRLLDEHPEVTALLQAHLGSALLWAGRYDEARAALTEVAECAGGAATALLREDALGRLALIEQLNGWPGRAERTARAAMTETERFGLPEPAGSGVARTVLAAVAVERNELRRAHALLTVADAPHPALCDPVLEAGRALATARLHLARGDTRAALAATGPAVDTVTESPWVRTQTALVAAAAHLAAGRADAAVELLEERLPDDRGPAVVAAARARLAAGRPDAARELLDRLRPDGRTGPAVTVRATLVRAQAADDTGDPAAARRLIGQALHDARRDLLRRPFLEAGPWIRPFLTTAPLRALADDWLTPGSAHGTSPSAASGSTPASVPPEDRPQPPVVEELSGRERDVVLRLSRMMSTEEIAADLYVSVNTVKTHLKSAYRKLSVNRRNDAVRRARELGLI
ncbi:LuxR C-terminal-related transcriptional regulator [Streptomyces antibioticus]|uniref:LuxR C-terminal-related transcriptional regulator n=1 Tax=Streptomyces antibioticus TaxID=1890 RepID=UPI00371EEF93